MNISRRPQHHRPPRTSLTTTTTHSYSAKICQTHLWCGQPLSNEPALWSGARRQISSSRRLCIITVSHSIGAQSSAAATAARPLRSLSSAAFLNYAIESIITRKTKSEDKKIKSVVIAVLGVLVSEMSLLFDCDKTENNSSLGP